MLVSQFKAPRQRQAMHSVKGLAWTCGAPIILTANNIWPDALAFPSSILKHNSVHSGDLELAILSGGSKHIIHVYCVLKVYQNACSPPAVVNMSVVGFGALRGGLLQGK